MIKEKEQNTIIFLKVNPNSKEFKIKGRNDWLQAIEVNVKSPATNNEANKELIKELEKIFKKKVEIIKGHKAKLKTILIQETKDKVLEKLK